MKKQNIGVIGGGAWGKNLIRVFHRLGVLSGVCDTNPQTLQEIAKKYPGIKLFPRADDLFQSPDLSAVAVAAPSALHYSLGQAALLAGKDLFVEKPLALSYSQGLELVKLAQQKKKILMAGHILEYHPAVSALENQIRSGELGELLYIYSSRLNLGKVRQEENILWSFAPHDLAVILRLLKEAPLLVSCTGGNYLNPSVADVTLTSLVFPGGVRGHLFVSWLHPYKEQKLIVVGRKKMALFDDVAKEGKLKLLDRRIEWEGGKPKATEGAEIIIPFREEEPLEIELKHFLDCLESRREPTTSGEKALPVLKILEASQHSLSLGGDPVSIGMENARHVHPGDEKTPGSTDFHAHPTAIIEKSAKIGTGTQIWHFTHISDSCEIGAGCRIGQNVYVGPGVKIGNRVKIQNNVSIYEGVVLEDDVFCGPSSVFTNVLTPRSHISRKHEFQATLVKKGATLGANSTILCGITIGEYALIGAGSVVTKSVPPYALVYGVPARVQGKVSESGEKLPGTSSEFCE